MYKALFKSISKPFPQQLSCRGSVKDELMVKETLISTIIHCLCTSTPWSVCMSLKDGERDDFAIKERKKRQIRLKTEGTLVAKRQVFAG